MVKRPSQTLPELLPTDSIFDRWGEAADAGFIPIPNSLVRAQSKLGLSPSDFIVVVNLLLHWWHRDRLPHPRSTAIAKRSGLGIRTVQRCVRKLEKKGLVQRIRAEKAVVHYDLTGLRDALVHYARQDVWHRPDLVRRTTSD